MSSRVQPAGFFSPVLLRHRVRIHPEGAHVVGVRRRLLLVLLLGRLRLLLLGVALRRQVLASWALPLVIAAPTDKFI
jgi:hypothetical protein